MVEVLDDLFEDSRKKSLWNTPRQLRHRDPLKGPWVLTTLVDGVRPRSVGDKTSWYTDLTPFKEKRRSLQSPSTTTAAMSSLLLISLTLIRVIFHHLQDDTRSWHGPRFRTYYCVSGTRVPLVSVHPLCLITHYLRFSSVSYHDTIVPHLSSVPSGQLTPTPTQDSLSGIVPLLNPLLKGLTSVGYGTSFKPRTFIEYYYSSLLLFSTPTSLSVWSIVLRGTNGTIL